jgi:hypothetical protein
VRIDFQLLIMDLAMPEGRPLELTGGRSRTPWPSRLPILHGILDRHRDHLGMNLGLHAVRALESPTIAISPKRRRDRRLLDRRIIVYTPHPGPASA